MIYLEGEATGFQIEEPAHTNPHIRRNRSLRGGKKCVCISICSVWRKMVMTNKYDFFCQGKPDLWTLPLFTAWNRKLLLSAKLPEQKVDVGISRVLNHFRIDVHGFHSAHKMRKINPQQFSSYHQDVISLCGELKYLSVYLRAAWFWVYVSESDMM